MGIIRNVVGVVAGYFVFAFSAVMLFRWSGIDPHAAATVWTISCVTAYGAVFSFAGGFLAKLIATPGTMIANYILALIVAGFAGFSLIMSGGEHYTQIAAILVFAPASVVGGYFRRRFRSEID